MRPSKQSFKGIDGFSTLLRKGDVAFAAEDIADALWLAEFMGDAVDASAQPESQESEDKSKPTVREEYADNDLDEEDSDEGAKLVLPQAQDSAQRQSQRPEGIPIKAPAAPALRIRLDLARALRPLRIKVPSPSRMVFDEIATVEQIADQRIWSPVMRPAPERWLDVALVVEETKSLAVWKDTIGDVQTLLERQGAFRRVTTWRLSEQADGKLALFKNWRHRTHQQRSRRAKELWDPAGRRLILLLSDCTSEAWRSGSMLKWLKLWGQQAPTAVMQLLPERLWSQSVLGLGVPVWFGAVEPGRVSDRLRVQYRMPLYEQLMANVEPAERIKVPIVTLQAETMKQWAKMVAGSGESKTLGVVFDGALPQIVQTVDSASQPSAAERVQRFRATASLVAQELAGLMSAAPVSPPIVDLIRQTLLPKAEPVHVAEVYMGGLMEPSEQDAQGQVSYRFSDEVRGLLAAAVPRSVSKQVLQAVSGYISKRLGLNTRSFEALLRIDFSGDSEAEGMVVPFATVATQTLRRMGREYAALAEQLQSGPKVAMQQAVAEPTDWVPLLQTFSFREATVGFAPSISVTGYRDRPEGIKESGNQSLFSFEFETARIDIRGRDSIQNERAEALLGALLSKIHQRTGNLEQLFLSDTQEKILKASFSGWSYDLMSYEFGYSVSHIGYEARKLWKTLSKALGVSVTKRSLIEVVTAQTGLELSDRKAAQERELVIVRKQQRSQQFVDDINGVELAMVAIPSGTFMMGSPESEEDRDSAEDPRHEVTIPSFSMSKYSVTQAQWRAVAEMSPVNQELDNTPSGFEGDERPVENVSWYDAVEFCDRLSNHTGRDYRLPSEAEWEYACRAGTQTPFHFGETLTTDLANYDGSVSYGAGPTGEYRAQTTNVGSFPANAFGLHDMHGNVWEWCLDHWHDSYKSAPTDGSAWLSDNESANRVLRGGSWNYDPENCRSAIRDLYTPGTRNNLSGFRVVCGSART